MLIIVFVFGLFIGILFDLCGYGINTIEFWTYGMLTIIVGTCALLHFLNKGKT